VTQRDAPPRLKGIDDDEDEEKTSVGAAPDPDALRPSPLGQVVPPKVSYGKFNTPTAFTPHQGPAQPQSPLHQDPRSSAAMTSARAVNNGPPDSGSSGPPKSQSMPRPPSGANMPRVNHSSGPPSVRSEMRGDSSASAMMPDRGSSGPQPLTAQPMVHSPMGGPPAQSGLMPFASQHQQGQSSSTPPQRNDHSYAGGSPPSGLGLGAQSGLGQAGVPLPGSGAMIPVGAQAPGALGLRADQAPRENRAAAFHITRSRAYSFVLDARNQPIELGSGRFAKAYLGEERWLESKTDFRKPVVIKILQKGVSEEDHMRFQMEMELLERVQGHPNIVELMCSGENEDVNFLPASIRDKVDSEFMILEKLEMSLEERLKGSRVRGHKEELLQCDMRERLFRVLDYMIPITSAVEYSHLVRNICHRDIKPANVLIALPDPNLRGSTLQVRLADFNVAKLSDEEVHFGMTQMKAAVPGTLFFQSPEQETNIIELLVNVQQGLPEVEYFEDFYIQIAKNDSMSLFNRNEQYPVLYADRARKRLVLGRPFREMSETNVRARIQKSVGRPADIYSLGATFYYLISGAYANPKTLYDEFHKFIGYERADENNTIEAYLRHEYSVINSLRAPKSQDGSPEVAPADRFFSYKHFLDGNGELIDPNVMLIIAKCMIRNKPDSYCQAHDLDTRGISEVVTDLINLYSLYGFQPGARPTHLVHRTNNGKRSGGKGALSSIRLMWQGFLSMFRKKR
jgi:serine/threonine protein kinase